MKPNRRTLAAVFLLFSVLFQWSMLYVTYNSFRWTVHIGDGEYGLCHVKSWLYLALGNFENRVDIHPYTAAAIITLSICLPSLALIFLIRKLVALDSKADAKPLIIGSKSAH